LAPEQEGASHIVSRGYFEQPPTPSQVPVCPQLGLPSSTQTPRGSGRPSSIGQQVPSLSGRLQATQPPWQATLQQIPSAQNPDWQSALALQLIPFIRLPQLPPTQARPAAHCELSVQLPS
jgi:hypothetical protein